MLVWYSARLRAHWRDAADRFGCYIFDLTEDLQAEIEAQGSAQAARLLCFPISVHYAPEGHRIVARALTQLVQPLP